MTAAIWIALIVFAAAVIGGTAFAALRALAAWRAFRSLRRNVEAALLDTSRRSAEVAERVAGAAATAARLDVARRRLQEGLAEAALLAGAAGEGRAVVRRVTGIVPRK